MRSALETRSAGPGAVLTGAIALIDGEHHPSAVRDALARLGSRMDVRGALFCGGEEKLGIDVLARPERHYGIAVTVGTAPARALRELAARTGASVVVDLADEPVLGAREKLALACTALDAGLRYVGADFDLRPPELAPLPFDGPRLAVIGTGKRTGKTAVCGHWAALLRDAGRRPRIVAIGRRAPAQP